MASELSRSEVQVLQLKSAVTSDTLTGNFRLSWGEGGEETDYLPWNVGEVELEAALEALQEIRDVQVPRLAPNPLLVSSGVGQQQAFVTATAGFDWKNFLPIP